MKGLLKKGCAATSAVTLLFSGIVPVKAEDTITVEQTEEIISTMRNQASEISVLLAECEVNGIPTAYEKPAEKILNQFATFLEEDIAAGDLARVYYTKKTTTDIYNEAKTNLEAYLAGEKTARYVPRYITSDMTVDGQSTIATVKGENGNERRPVFYVGYGHSDYLSEFIPQFKDYGMNAVQNECGIAYCIKTIDLSDWKAEILGNGSVERCTDTVKAGSGAARITYTEAKDGEYVSLFQYVDVTPGKTYEFKGYVKGAASAGVHVGLSEDGFENQTAYSGTFNWKSFSIKYTVPEGVTRLTPRIVCNDVTTALYLDSLMVRETGTVTNLLANGDFETADGYGIKFDKNAVQDKIEILNEQLKSAEESDIAFDLLLSVQKSFTSDIKNYLDAYGICASDGNILKEAKNSLKYRINHPKVNELVELYLKNYIPMIKGYKSVKSLCITNEPQFDVSAHGDYYLADWQNYLENRYVSIDALNTSYGTAYSDFNEIGFYNPSKDGVAKCYDHKKFNDNLLASWHEWMTEIIKEIWPEAVVHSKIMGYTYDSNRTNNGTGYAEYTDIFDLNGCDYWNYINDDLGPLTKNMWYDYMTSLKNAPIINSEDHVIEDSNQVFSAETAQHVGQDIYQGAIHGRGMSEIWLWARGKESNTWGSLLYRPDVIWEISKASLDLNRNAYEITALQNQEREVGILYSDASIVNDEYAMHAVYEAYASAVFNGKRAEFITEENPESITGKKLVIVPKQQYVTSDMIAELESYILSGGRVLIMGEDSLWKNEYNLANDTDTVRYIYSNADVISYDGGLKNMIYPESYEFYGYVRNILTEEDAYSVSVIDTFTNEPIKDAEYNVAEYNGKTLININNYGTAKNIKILVDGCVATEVYDIRNNETVTSGIKVDQYESATFRVDKTEEISVTQESRYIPQNAFVSYFNKGLLLSWKNPQSDTLEDIKIYSVTDTEEKLLTDSISNTPSEYVMYSVENLEIGESYRYKAVFSYSDRIDASFYFTGVPVSVNEPLGTETKNITVSSGAKSFGSWSVDIKNQSYKGASSTNPVYEKRQPFKYTLDTKEKYGDTGASLRIDSNAVDYENTSAFNNIFVHLQTPKMTLKANTPYKLTYRTKTKDLKQYMIHMSWAKFSEDKLNTNGPVSGTTDWTQHELVHITGNSDETKQLMLIFKYMGTLWVDDFELYEAEAVTVDGITTYNKKADAQNLIADWNFDDISGCVPALQNVSAVMNADGDVTINWDKEEYSGINIYEYINGTYEYKGVIPADTNSVKLIGVGAGEHRYILEPVNEYGVTGEQIEVKVKEEKLSEYIPKTLFVKPFNEGLVLSWKNPDAIDLKDIKVYDITNGDEVLMQSPEMVTPSKYVLYSVENLENGKAYQYKVVFKFKSYDDVIYYLGGTPKKINEPAESDPDTSVYEDKKKFGTWSAQIVNQTHRPGAANPTLYEKRMPMKYSLDEKVKCGEGGASLKLEANAIDYDNSSAFSRMYAQVTSGNVSLKGGTTYKLTYRAKSENLKQLRMHFGWVRFDEGSGFGNEVPISGTTDWTQYEAIYTPTADVTAGLIIMASDTGTVWVDDFELYEAEAVTDSVTGVVSYKKKDGAVNLMQNMDCNFDSILSSDDVGIVNGITASNGDGELVLQWNSTTGDVAGMNVYELVRGTYEYRGTVNAALRKVLLSGFDAGESKSFRLVPVTSLGIEGGGTQIKYTPSVYTSFGIVTQSGVSETEIIRPGTIRVISNFRSNDYNIAVISALYNGSTLVAVNAEEITAGGDADTPYEYTKDYVIPDDDGDYKIKVMYWEGLETMKPILFKELYK